MRLTLSVDEAIDWAGRGGLVQILCHASSDSGEVSEGAEYNRQRRFNARSADLTIQVQVILVARFEGACPNLRSDMFCGIYDDRPNVCRIYPAEVIPGRRMDPASKICPPDAWDNNKPSFLTDDGQIVDRVTHEAVVKARAASLLDLRARQSLVASLGINITALENDGFTVWTFDPPKLLPFIRHAALSRTRFMSDDVVTEWSFMALRPETTKLILSSGAALMTESPPSHLDFLPLY